MYSYDNILWLSWICMLCLLRVIIQTTDLVLFRNLKMFQRKTTHYKEHDCMQLLVWQIYRYTAKWFVNVILSAYFIKIHTSCELLDLVQLINHNYFLPIICHVIYRKGLLLYKKIQPWILIYFYIENQLAAFCCSLVFVKRTVFNGIKNVYSWLSWFIFFIQQRNCVNIPSIILKIWSNVICI